jgi:pimeloyl-ACP methyl ester carboxylesterase
LLCQFITWEYDLNLSHALDLTYLRYLWLNNDRACTYISDHSLNETLPNIRRAVLVVHGIERDGYRYWKALARAARRAGPSVQEQTLLLAPQFFVRKQAFQWGLEANTLTWRSQAWKQGDLSRKGGVSSFSTIDALIQQLLCAERFPALAQIVIVGHSAGAQFVQRYAAAGRGAGLARMRGIGLRHIVVGPSSYLYLNNARRGFGPAEGFGEPCGQTVMRCPDYDNYKYGLQHANAYVRAMGPERIRRDYASKEVVYLVGEHDDQTDNQHLDCSPAAMLQGHNRVDRCLAYRDHLVDLYGALPVSHAFEVVPGLGHEGPRILRSPAGLRWIFDVSKAAREARRASV